MNSLQVTSPEEPTSHNIGFEEGRYYGLGWTKNQIVKKMRQHGSMEAGKEASIHQTKTINYKELQDVL